MKKWWVSCDRFTVQVVTNSSDVIVFAAPIVKKFMNQPMSNLIGWMTRKFKAVIVKEL